MFSVVCMLTYLKVGTRVNVHSCASSLVNCTYPELACKTSGFFFNLLQQSHSLLT